jgi:hypothetical protein
MTVPFNEIDISIVSLNCNLKQGESIKATGMTLKSSHIFSHYKKKKNQLTHPQRENTSVQLPARVDGIKRAKRDSLPPPGKTVYQQ